MAKGWCCDRCGKWFRGQGPEAAIIGNPREIGIHLRLEVWTREESGRPDRDYCDPCKKELARPLLLEWLGLETLEEESDTTD